MRAFGRDLIRGGHYGQRSCEPRQQAEHMAAPTNAAKREKSSCQLGAVQTTHNVRLASAMRVPAKPVDATQALNLSAGVSNCKVSRGRSLSWRGKVRFWRQAIRQTTDFS